MAQSFFDKILKKTDNEYINEAMENIGADVEFFIDTGSYSLNAIMSGSIYGGLAVKRVTALAGESATGKTFYALHIAKNFLDSNPHGAVYYFDSESAVTSDMLKEKGIMKNFYILEVATIEEFRTQSMKLMNAYIEATTKEEREKKPILIILDSLGNCSTNKEIGDIAEGNESRDMSRTTLIKGAFRVLTLKAARAKTAFLVTNHVYADFMSYGAPKKMSGGSGIHYAASTIIFLGKSKVKTKDKKEVTGAILTATVAKSRFTIEYKSIDTLLDYKTGLNRYYGLLDLAVKHDIVEKGHGTFTFPDKTVAKGEDEVYNNPEKYFTKPVLDLIDAAAKKEFMYGSANKLVSEED